MNDLDAIAVDLATIVVQAKWAHGYAYAKTGRGLTAERGVDLHESEDDKIAHAKMFDLDIGDNKARVAYQRAVRAVGRADVLLASLVEGPQRPLLRLTVFSRPDEVETVAGNAVWRCGRATGKNVLRIVAVRKSVDRSVRGLSKAMGDGRTDAVQTAEVLCRTCRIRERGVRTLEDGSTRPNSSECETCRQWRQRNGHPRPSSLDSGPVMAARAAQARRRERGDDFGAA